jgi:cytochrome c oxidase subunit 3
VQKSLRLGMVLFIVSEILFFFAFFWAFFHSSLAPTHVLGCVWPPHDIDVFSPFKIPLLNTCILLTSGATITLAHYSLLDKKNQHITKKAFAATIALAIVFTGLQVFEYMEAPFSISDGIYGSTFYMSTGFHGLHVIIGTIFIIVGFLRFNSYHFTLKNHFGFEASAWYWHFVDVVWLILYISIYYWGNM